MTHARPDKALTDPEFISTNGVRLHVVRAGPDTGRLVILLHGFPEFWYAWRHQIGPLAEAGYRVWAPDQRGYSTSDKPAGVAAYTIDILAADVIGLLDAAGVEKVGLVGHDWGGAVAWRVASLYPDRVSRLVVLNAPHGRALMRRMRQDVAQLWRSWYIFFFQIPWLPELVLRQLRWALLARSLRGSSRAGTFSDADLAEYRHAWSQPGAVSSMINWYRAALRTRARRTESERIVVPTLLIWGARDAFLGRELAEASIQECDNGRLVFIEDATHWVQHEAADRVNALLMDFLR